MKQKAKIEYKRSVLYARVSSDRQVKEGHGLDSQDQRCKVFSNSQGLEVAAVFPDEGISGALLERPAFRSLLNFLDEYSNEKFVVIIDDISRLARDVKVHLQLRLELEKREAKLMSPNFQFENSPEGEFIEIIMSGKAQLDRKQNTRQVMQKMKARLEVGFWPFCPPPGLKNVKGLLTPIEPLASIYKEAIEQFRDYKLNTLQAARDFILLKYSEQGIKKTLSLNGTQRILTNLLYSGYIEYEPWGVTSKKGQHKGFISHDTYLAVQEKLNNKAKPRIRKDYNEDFPVRGYALCLDCQKRMTAAWFKARNGERHPYYLCKTIGCCRKNKSFLKADLEASFEKLLRKVQPQAEALEFIKAVVNDLWKDRSVKETTIKGSLSRAISDLELKNASLTTRIAKAGDNDAIVAQYEKVITANFMEIEKLKTKLAKIKYNQNDFQTALAVVINFVASPIKQWQSKNYRRQRLLLGMYFDERLTYDPILGFQTAQLPLILELSQQKIVDKTHLVEMPGVKPGSKTCSSSHYSQD